MVEKEEHCEKCGTVAEMVEQHEEQGNEITFWTCPNCKYEWSDNKGWR